MYPSILLAVALGTSTIVAAPVWPALNVDNVMIEDSLEAVSEYFNLLAAKVNAGRDTPQAPSCDLSNAVLPQAPEPLASPSEGLVLKHIALGRGTQNYTCDLSNSTATPQAAGAVATLFNASCVASAYPDLLAMLSNLAMKFAYPIPSGENSPARLGPSNLAVSGQHFFTDLKTPFFNLDTPQSSLGQAPCSKDSQTPAPANAPAGHNGEKAVPWLKLLTKDGATGNLQEVYRVETAGGSAPASCTGMAAAFEVQYSAQYWFYEHL